MPDVDPTRDNANECDADHGLHCREDSNASAILIELREHIPFSVTAVAIGLIVAGAICILGSGVAGGIIDAPASDHDGHEHGPRIARLFFHLFHPAHMLFSAAATAAMFCRYDRKILKGIVIGLIGAIGICGISDIALPHLSLTLLGVKTPLHICVVERPSLVLPFAVTGVLIGVATAGRGLQTTFFSHSLHVLASTMASIFYMVGALGLVAWIDRLGTIFVLVVLAVMVPCCLSDIVFPMLMSHAGRLKYGREPHSH